MQVFKTMSIANKLRAAFAALLVLLVFLAFFAFSRLQSVQRESHEISSNWLPSVRSINAMNTNTSDYRVGLLLALAAENPEQRGAAEKEMAEVMKLYVKNRDTYLPLISSDEERKTYERFAALWTRYIGLAEKMAALARDGKADEARAVQRGEGRPVFVEASDLLDKLVEINDNGAAASAANSEGVYRSAVTWLVVVSVLAAAAAVLMSMALVRSIISPLARAVGAADRVADGDLSQRIESEGTDETAQLLQAMQRMQQSLVNTVGQVRSGAESVATASAEIAQGNADLSSRTEEQASSLEETSATMEELNATVRQNADNAAQANQLAQSASEVARDGGVVVGEVVSTMRGIEDSSKRIADIISVIDGIAFQTNILALNAAVEAARAGEQGRGFAVVASEVRSLAQRSAEAAKEIKSLITDSVERVQSGTVLVDRAGQTIQNIVGSVQRLADIVGEISSASREQSSGISQVGEAVTQLDRATQQNAALVEESAAASESLKTQAQNLLGAVASFKLEGQPVRAKAPVAIGPKPSPKSSPKPTSSAGKPVVRSVPTPTPPKATPRPAPAVAAPAADGEWSSF